MEDPKPQPNVAELQKLNLEELGYKSTILYLSTTLQSNPDYAKGVLKGLREILAQHEAPRI